MRQGALHPSWPSMPGTQPPCPLLGGPWEAPELHSAPHLQPNTWSGECPQINLMPEWTEGQPLPAPKKGGERGGGGGQGEGSGQLPPVWFAQGRQSLGNREGRGAVDQLSHPFPICPRDADLLVGKVRAVLRPRGCPPCHPTVFPLTGNPHPAPHQPRLNRMASPRYVPTQRSRTGTYTHTHPPLLHTLGCKVTDPRRLTVLHAIAQARTGQGSWLGAGLGIEQAAFV